MHNYPILNESQNNFTQENMNKEVTLKLSNEKQIKYMVGDKPFMSTCDYMEKCSYKCSPNIKVDELNINCLICANL